MTKAKQSKAAYESITNDCIQAYADMNQNNDHTFFVSADQDIPELYKNTELTDMLNCLRKRSKCVYEVTVDSKISSAMRAFNVSIKNKNIRDSEATLQILEQYENKSGVYLRCTSSFLYKVPNGAQDYCLTTAYGPITIVLPLVTFVLENL